MSCFEGPFPQQGHEVPSSTKEVEKFQNVLIFSIEFYFILMNYSNIYYKHVYTYVHLD